MLDSRGGRGARGCPSDTAASSRKLQLALPGCPTRPVQLWAFGVVIGLGMAWDQAYTGAHDQLRLLAAEAAEVLGDWAAICVAWRVGGCMAVAAFATGAAIMMRHLPASSRRLSGLRETIEGSSCGCKVRRNVSVSTTAEAFSLVNSCVRGLHPEEGPLSPALLMSHLQGAGSAAFWAAPANLDAMARLYLRLTELCRLPPLDEPLDPEVHTQAGVGSALVVCILLSTCPCCRGMLLILHAMMAWAICMHVPAAHRLKAWAGAAHMPRQIHSFHFFRPPHKEQPATCSGLAPLRCGVLPPQPRPLPLLPRPASRLPCPFTD